MEIASHLNELLILAAVMLLGVMSPGPDFVMAVRNSVRHGRAAGLMTAVGLGLGVMVHLTYIMLGLGVIISQSILLFNLLKWFGAAYLFWIGIKAIRSKGMKLQAAEMHELKTPYPVKRALADGFLTNVLNPKATLFFLALFTQILSPNVAAELKFVYSVVCVTITVSWFSIVATVLTQPKIRDVFLRFSKWVDRMCGAVFIMLGLRLVTAKAGH